MKRAAELDDPCQDLPKNRQEKSAIITSGPYQPRISIYPTKEVGKGKNLREISFKPKWFDNYKWLEYSVAKNAAFCFACRCFALNDNSLPGLVENAFTTTGFSFWHNDNEMFRYHEKSKCHV